MNLVIVVAVGIATIVAVTEGIDWVCKRRRLKCRKVEFERWSLIGEKLCSAGNKATKVKATLEKLRDDLKEARIEVFGDGLRCRELHV